MNVLLPLAMELPDGWTIREIAGLVFIGILTWVIWIKFRQMQFPHDWEHGPGPKRDPKEAPAPNEQKPPPPNP